MSEHNDNPKPEDLYAEHKDRAEELGVANDLLNEVDAAPTHTPSDKEAAIEMHTEAKRAYDESVVEAKKTINESEVISEATDINSILKAEQSLEQMMERAQTAKNWDMVSRIAETLNRLEAIKDGLDLTLPKERSAGSVEGKESETPREFVDKETAGFFNLDSLDDNDVSQLADLMETVNRKEIFNIVSQRCREMKDREYARTPTRQEAELYRQGDPAGDRLPEAYVNEQASRKVLTDEEIKELESALAGKRETGDRQADARLLTLVIRAYSDFRKEREEIDISGKLYTDRYWNIGSSRESQLTAEDLSKILLASDYLSKIVVPRKRVEKRSGRVVGVRSLDEN